MTRLIAAVLALLAVVALTACGEKEETLGTEGSSKLTLMLDYFPNADHAGIYAAQAGGMFKQAGLDVTIRQPPDPAAPIKQVAAGRADLAISYEPEVLRARDQGLNVVAVGAIVRKPLTSIISLPKGKIRSPRDLEGKTVGTAGIDYQAAYLRTILDRAGVDPSTVKTRNLGFNLVGPLVAGKVDAVLGAFWNYRASSCASRSASRASSGWSVPACPPTTSWCWWPTRTRSSATARASARSWALWPAAPRRWSGTPTRASKGCWRPTRTWTPSSSARRQGHPAAVPARAGPAVRLPGPREWKAFAGWMSDNRLTTKVPDARGAFDNRFLPGGGL